MSDTKIIIYCVLSFAAGLGLALLLGSWSSTLPRVTVRNGTEEPLVMEEFEIAALKWDRKHPPRTLEPGETASISMPDPRMGTAGNARVTWVAEGKRYRITAGVGTDKHSTITIELGSGGFVRVGHRVGGGWRRWCYSLTVETRKFPDPPGSDPD